LKNIRFDPIRRNGTNFDSVLIVIDIGREMERGIGRETEPGGCQKYQSAGHVISDIAGRKKE